MKIGVMNDPKLDLLDEARWVAQHGFDFLDLTIEGPRADLGQFDPAALRALLEQAGMGVVGHTAWFLPFSSPVERVRRAAVEEAAAALPTFAAVGARLVNVHISRGVASFGPEQTVASNRASFAELAERAAPLGIQIMVEHPPDPRLSVEDICRIMDADPRLGFHLDVGHAFVGGARLAPLLQALGPRLAHVHLSDNKGRTDDHLPLGAGRIDWPEALRLLRSAGYDGTFTLEVFTPDREFVMRSAQKLRAWWEAAGRT